MTKPVFCCLITRGLLLPLSFQALMSIFKRFNTKHTGKSVSMSEDYEILVALSTDIGCRRANNEDSIQYFSLPGDRKTGLAIVADGMGGHKAGEVASKEAVDTIGAYCLAKNFANPMQTLIQAYREANNRIHRLAAEDVNCRGMGTTATALMFAEGAACFAHVGDSRLYRISNNNIEQLTRDHTLVAQLLEHGVITEDQAKSHPNKNVLTSALGTYAHVGVDVSEQLLPIRIGDQFLLCSDGLFDGVSDERIKMIMLENKPEQACNALINAALAAGGHDNISVIVLAVAQNQ